MGGKGSGIEQIRNAYKVFIGKFGRKNPIGRPRCRWEDIVMDPKTTGWVKGGWIRLGISLPSRQTASEREHLIKASVSWGYLAMSPSLLNEIISYLKDKFFMKVDH
jgi:hypothetical protein